MQKFWLMVGAVVLAALTALGSAVADNVLEVGEGLNTVVITAEAAVVFTAANVPGAKYTKAVLAVILAVCTLPVSYFTGGFTWAEGIQIAIAVLGALGVRQLGNTGDLYDRVINGEVISSRTERLAQ